MVAVSRRNATVSVVPSLHDGVTLSCPECGRCMPLWDWNRPGRALERPVPYHDQLLVAYRCPVNGCRFIFAPIPRGYRLVPE